MSAKRFLAASWVRVAVGLGGRPDLWAEAVRVGVRLAPRDWWRAGSGSMLPLPSDSYLRFRAETQYGDPSVAPTSKDVIVYLEWCKRQRSLR